MKMVTKKISAPMNVNKGEKSDSHLVAVVVAVLVSFMLTMLAIKAQDEAFGPKLTRLTLTSDGCEYLQAQVGIAGKPFGRSGGCQVDVDFVSYKIGSGGSVYFGIEDKESLEVSGGQIVGVIKLPEDPNKRWTFQQKRATWLLVAAFVLMAAVPFFMYWSTRDSK